MTGMGEEVFTHTPEADALVEKAAKAVLSVLAQQEPVMSDLTSFQRMLTNLIARAALSSLGLPLSDLQWAAENAEVVRALREGVWRAVPDEPTRAQIDAMCDAPLHPTVFPMYRAALKAAPKSPSEESAR